MANYWLVKKAMAGELDLDLVGLSKDTVKGLRAFFGDDWYHAELKRRRDVDNEPDARWQRYHAKRQQAQGDE